MKHQDSHRPLRVAELIKSILIQLINQGKAQDVRLFDANLTLTEVKVSPDLKVAYCYVMPFASRISPEDLLEALNNSKSHLRMLVGEKLSMKNTPELRFVYDQGQDNAEQVDKILMELSNT